MTICEVLTIVTLTPVSGYGAGSNLLPGGADRGRFETCPYHEYLPTGPLSLRERVGVRVKSTSTYPCEPWLRERGVVLLAGELSRWSVVVVVGVEVELFGLAVDLALGVRAASVCSGVLLVVDGAIWVEVWVFASLVCHYEFGL